MTYRLTKSADRDVVEIWKYIQADNVRAADAVYAMFYEKFSTLAANPLIGVTNPTISRGIRKFPAGQYLVYYQVTKGVVVITRVLHGKRQQRRAYVGE